MYSRRSLKAWAVMCLLPNVTTLRPFHRSWLVNTALNTSLWLADVRDYLKHHPELRTSGAQEESVASDLLPMDTEHHVLAGLVTPQPPKELSVGLPPLGHCGQHLVIQQQLPDGVSQGPVHTSLTLKCVWVAHSSVNQQVFNLEVGHIECYETASQHPLTNSRWPQRQA